MDYNHQIDTSNKGRTIGNGVIMAYAAAVIGIVALTMFAGLDAQIGLGVFVAMFLAVFAGDLFIQWYDMNGKEPSGAAARLQARATDGGEEETDERVTAE